MNGNPGQLRRRPVIRVFVSSTFADLKHERDALQRDVFPKLEQYCASRQFQFQAIDLRWGVPTEASLDHRTMRICFEELRRSQEISPQPNFLILLGNRYGWRPLPEEISQAEFEKLAAATNPETNNPIPGTHGKTAQQVLKEWYRCDENVLVPDQPTLSPDHAPLNYILRPRTQHLGDGRKYTRNEDGSDMQDWVDVQQVLWRIINATFPPEALDRRFDIDWGQHVADVNNRQHPKRAIPQLARFQGSATEQEIWCGALSSVNAEQHVIACFREIVDRDDFAPAEAKDYFDVAEGRFDELARNRQAELKAAIRRRLGDKAIVPIPFSRLKREQQKLVVDGSDGATKKFCEDVERRLRPIITRQMDEYWGTSDLTIASPRELELERDEHHRFGQERAPVDSFVGRERHLQAIKAYIQGDSRQPLVIHGASGCGKTALLAKAAQEIQKSGVSGQKTEVIVRFIGVTPRSSDIRSLLASLCQELRQRHPVESPLLGDVRDLTKELHEHFNAVTAEQPLILFLDALDQLTDADNGRSLFWIPFGQLPAHVKLIVSCLSDRAPEDPDGQPYTALQGRGFPQENFVNLDALTEAEAQRLLFDRWLPQARRKLNAEQAQCIRERLKSEVCRQPLYLKVLFEEARLWKSDDRAPTLDDNVSDLLGGLFQRLGDPANHGVTVECALGYIAAARRGLTEMEILEVLYRDPEYGKFIEQITARTGHKLPDNPKRIPIAIWSRLRFDLAPYLAEHAAPGGTVLNFYHRQVAEYVRDRFLDTPQKRQKRHERLAEYFHDQDYFLESLEEQRARAKRLPPTPRPANVRKVDELPWQRLETANLSEQWNAVDALFTDLFFLEAKTEVGLVFELADDFRRVLKAMPIERSQIHMYALLGAAIRRDVHFITRHPTTLFQSLWNSCWWYDCPQAARHYPKPDTGWLQGEPPWDQDKPKLYALLEVWRAYKDRLGLKGSWMRSLRPPPIPIDCGMATALPLNRQNALRFNEIIWGGAGKVSLLHFDESDEILWAWINTNSRDGIMCSQVWDLRSGVEIDTSRFPNALCPRTHTSPDGQLTIGNCDLGAFCVVSVDGVRTHSVVPLGEDQICRESVFSPSGDGLAYGAEGVACASAVGLWCLKTLRKVFEIELKEPPWALAFSNNGRWLAVGDLKGSVNIIDVIRGAVSFAFKNDGQCIDAIGVTDDGSQCAIAVHGFVQFFRFPVSNRASNFMSHVNESPHITEMLFSPDGSRLVTRSTFATTILWNTKDGNSVGFLRNRGEYLVGGPPAQGTCCTNERVVSVDYNDISIYSAFDGSVIGKEEISTYASDRIVFTQSGDYFLRIRPDPEDCMVLFSSTKPDINQCLKSLAAVVAAVSRPKSEEFICAHADGTISVWSIESTEPKQTIASGLAQIKSVLCTNDGNHVIVQCAEGVIAVWNLNTCGLVCSWQLPSPSSRNTGVDTSELIVSCDAKYLVVLFENGMSEAYRIDSGERIAGPAADDSAIVQFLANTCRGLRRDCDTEIRRLSGGVCGWLPLLGWTVRSPAGHIWAVAQSGQVYLFALENYAMDRVGALQTFAP